MANHQALLKAKLAKRKLERLTLDARLDHKAKQTAELLVNPPENVKELVVLVGRGGRSDHGECGDQRAQDEQRVVSHGENSTHGSFSCEMVEQLVDTFAWLYTGWAYNLGQGFRDAGLCAQAAGQRSAWERLFATLCHDGELVEFLELVGQAAEPDLEDAVDPPEPEPE